ncbi:hypothetical protein [Nonomuraea dietziae]|uniref:Uncharacterized protein n=1 Tax=Nonomuraea dietziae TaxID=65515 RepID=A0A7W5YBD2_9ACTN|nr:hypothetical protein [Nonomuraea dietziae]MBB3731241.1 hypothetical protein [Nonomuraea dietziae]
MSIAMPRLSPGGRAWLWVVVAALAWTVQVGGLGPAYAEAFAAEGENVAVERLPVSDDTSRRTALPVRRPSPPSLLGRHDPVVATPAAPACVRKTALRTLLCVWRT